MRWALDSAFSWELFGFVDPILIGTGFTLIGVNEFRGAKICFWLSALWTYGKVLMWSYVSQNSFISRSLVVFLFCGVLGVGLMGGLRLVNRKQSETQVEITSPSQDQQKPPKLAGQPQPLA